MCEHHAKVSLGFTDEKFLDSQCLIIFLKVYRIDLFPEICKIRFLKSL